jgi:hypothetical protein
MADEKRIKVAFPLPDSTLKDAHDVQVKESTERWTEVVLEDETVVRVKMSIVGAARIENEYDAQGNPAYSLQMSPQVHIVSTAEKFKKPVKGSAIQ